MTCKKRINLKILEIILCRNLKLKNPNFSTFPKLSQMEVKVTFKSAYEVPSKINYLHSNNGTTPHEFYDEELH